MKVPSPNHWTAKENPEINYLLIPMDSILSLLRVGVLSLIQGLRSLKLHGAAPLQKKSN